MSLRHRRAATLRRAFATLTPGEAGHHACSSGSPMRGRIWKPSVLTASSSVREVDSRGTSVLIAQPALRRLRCTQHTTQLTPAKPAWRPPQNEFGTRTEARSIEVVAVHSYATSTGFERSDSRIDVCLTKAALVRLCHGRQRQKSGDMHVLGNHTSYPCCEVDGSTRFHDHALQLVDRNATRFEMRAVVWSVAPTMCAVRPQDFSCFQRVGRHLI